MPFYRNCPGQWLCNAHVLIPLFDAFEINTVKLRRKSSKPLYTVAGTERGHLKHLKTVETKYAEHRLFRSFLLFLSAFFNNIKEFDIFQDRF